VETSRFHLDLLQSKCSRRVQSKAVYARKEALTEADRNVKEVSIACKYLTSSKCIHQSFLSRRAQTTRQCPPPPYFLWFFDSWL